MKRSLSVALFACVVVCALAASGSFVPAGEGAGGGEGGAGGGGAAAGPPPEAAATPQRDERLWRRALELQKKAVVIDGHNDIPTIMVDEDYDIGVPSAGKYHTDIARLKQPRRTRPSSPNASDARGTT